LAHRPVSRYEVSCNIFLSKLKTDFQNEFDSNSLISSVLEFNVTSQIIDIAEMLVPSEICDNNTPNKTKTSFDSNEIR